jgi:hypothetical protein
MNDLPEPVRRIGREAIYAKGALLFQAEEKAGCLTI